MNLPTRFPGAKALRAFLCLLGCVVGFSAQSTLSTSRKEVRVHADGSLTGVADALRFAESSETSATARYSFGLPAGPPQRRWLEAGDLPISHTQWETNGIRYLQTVLMTFLNDGDVKDTNSGRTDSVLLVRIMGESLTNQYAPAEAALRVRIGEDATRLELSNLVVYATPHQQSIPLAVLDISPSAVHTNVGHQLHFQASIPPGTSGSMVIKIPATGVRDELTLNRLLDLDFERELQRVNRLWTTVPPKERSAGAPVRLALDSP